VSYPLQKAALRKAAFYAALIALLLPAGVSRVFAEDVQSQPAAAADHLPYTFNNFAWWTDTQLRAELKQRIPGLGDDLVGGSAQEARVRAELTSMLLAKGVHATVVSNDPSAVSTQVSAFMASLPFFVPDGSDPRPHITFSIAAPQVVIGTVTVDAAPDSQSDLLARIAQQIEGKPFDSNSLQLQARQLVEPMEHNGYLSASIRLSPGQPQLQDGRYTVPLDATVDAGPVYHVGLVSADGGPLLRGRDLSPYFDLQPGEVATPYAFQRLESSIMTVYFQSGYASIHFQDVPILDREHGIATYRLLVFTGPQFRLRTVTLHNLSPAQENEVRNLLELQPGDVYDQVAIDELHQKVQESANLHGLDYSFVPQTDRQHNVIDLTLDFFKDTAQSSL
jgi:outer membrane translocation and assembly module TamA